MDGKILTGGLVSLKGTDLRMIYALLFKTNIGNLLYSKAKDVFTKEDVQHFNAVLEAEVDQLAKISDAALQVDLFLEMTKILKLRGTKYTTEKEIADQGTKIIDGVYESMLKDKPFKAYTKERAVESKVYTIINYQMQKLFSKVDENLENVSVEDQDKFVEQVRAYLESLPAEKQEKIKEKLGIDDLTNNVLKQTMAVSGTSLMFAVIVEVSGFAFYTTATSLLASVAGAIGLTLPFGAYTFLTSAIAVLVNPIFLVALLVGGGAFFTTMQNRSLKKKLLPIIVLQISLPFVSEGVVSPDYAAFTREWERRFAMYVKVTRQYMNSNQNIVSYEKAILVTEQTLENKKQAETSAETEITAIKKDIYQAITAADFATIEVNASFKERSEEYERLTESIIAETEQRNFKPVAENVFDKLKQYARDAKTGVDIKREERKRHVLLEKMVEDVLDSTTDFESANRRKVKTNALLIHNLQEEEKALKNELKRLEKELKAEKSTANQLAKQMKEIEKENYGLADLYISSEPEKLASESNHGD